MTKSNTGLGASWQQIAKPATPFRRTPDVIAKLESDRARLIEALGDAERRFKIASEEDISDSTFSEWAHEARSLLRELESK